MNDRYNRILKDRVGPTPPRGAASVFETARRGAAEGETLSSYGDSTSGRSHRALVLTMGALVTVAVLGALVAMGGDSGGPTPEALQVGDDPSSSITAMAEDVGPDSTIPSEVLDRFPAELWTGVHGPDVRAFVPTAFLDSAFNGQVSEVVDSSGAVIGYLIFGGGYVEASEFESPGFDWRAHVRTWFAEDPEIAEDRIESIDRLGGLSEVRAAVVEG